MAGRIPFKSYDQAMIENLQREFGCSWEMAEEAWNFSNSLATRRPPYQGHAGPFTCAWYYLRDKVQQEPL